ncbi:MAG: hypothetical protein V4616_15285 [Bacteroidota bacterium]
MTTKLSKFALSLVLSTLTIISLAQASQNGAVTIIGSRFTYPYIRELIGDFRKVHPEVEIQLLERGTDTEDNANLIINGHEPQQDEIRNGYKAINFATYTILPVANAKNPWLAEVLSTGLDKKEIRSLFFNKDYDPIYNEKKEQQRQEKYERPDVHLFTRDQKACAPISFAGWFGFNQENIIGKRIVGSDLSLLYAVKSDEKGLTYNLPVHLYNLETRQPLSEWTIIPVDQDGNNFISREEAIYGNLDQLLEALASGKVQNVPTAPVNISLPQQITDDNRNLSLFVEYLLGDGQLKARKYGFLELSKDVAEKQRGQIATKL